MWKKYNIETFDQNHVPDSGTIEMKGRVSSLIELGAGFHPDMSGRDNIYINHLSLDLQRRKLMIE